jgi:hypothetical protein
MALSPEQKSSRLFKKSLGAGETLLSRQFFEEPRLGSATVLPEQIWSEAGSIPSTAPTLSNNGEDGVVKYLELLELTHVAGSNNLSYFSSELIDAIPFNFGDGTYNYGLFKNNGTTIINFGEGDWLLDTSAGLLTFYGDLPSVVNATSPPKISFYKYIGTKGLGTGGSSFLPGSGLSDNAGNLDVNVDSNSLEINGSDEVSLKRTITGPRIFEGSGTVSIDNDEGMKIRTRLKVGNSAQGSGLETIVQGSGQANGFRSIAFGTNTYAGATGAFVGGLGNRSDVEYEISLGIYGTTASSLDNPSNPSWDRLANFGNGSSASFSDRKDAWSLYRNGAQKLETRQLSNITNATKGFFALDENGRPNFYYNGQWNDVSESGGANTDPVYQTEIPTESHSTSASLTTITLSQTPSTTFTVEVYVNGQRQRLGETNTSDCWFGNITTATLFDNLSTGDALVWNAVATGFVLDTDDVVDIIYAVEV